MIAIWLYHALLLLTRTSSFKLDRVHENSHFGWDLSQHSELITPCPKQILKNVNDSTIFDVFLNHCSKLFESSRLLERFNLLEHSNLLEYSKLLRSTKLLERSELLDAPKIQPFFYICREIWHQSSEVFFTWSFFLSTFGIQILAIKYRRCLYVII